MDHLKGLLILIMAIGMITVVLQGAVRGWLPNGSRGFEEGEAVSRTDTPLGC